MELARPGAPIRLDSHTSLTTTREKGVPPTPGLEVRCLLGGPTGAFGAAAEGDRPGILVYGGRSETERFGAGRLRRRPAKRGLAGHSARDVGRETIGDADPTAIVTVSPQSM